MFYICVQHHGDLKGCEEGEELKFKVKKKTEVKQLSFSRKRTRFNVCM